MRLQVRGVRSATLQHRVLGVAFLALLAGGGWFTHAVFEKKFTVYADVEMRASRIGLQLESRADVKIRGVVVGEVRETRATGEGATLTLGLDPDRLDIIPANVTGRIAPKTLFGEKYVALEIPDRPDGAHLVAGDVIAQSTLAIEMEQVLSDLYPLLRTVQPAELNRTLTAVAGALEGRGEAIGDNLTVLNEYLERTNPKIPALVEDLRLLARVSDDYVGVVPELARVLRNSVTVGDTWVEKEQRIQALLGDTAGLSDTTRGFLDTNGDSLVRASELGAAQLRVLAMYAPEYPCLLEAIVNIGPRQAEAFRGYALHIDLEMLPNQPRGFTSRDQHVNGDRRGPYCGSLPNPPWTQSKLPPADQIPDIVDGVDEPLGKMRTTLGPTTPTDVGTLLLGPLARRGEVTVR